MPCIPVLFVAKRDAFASFSLRDDLLSSAWRVEAAAPGAPTFAALDRCNPAVAVIDIDDADGDGLKTARAIRAGRGARGSLPLVATTAQLDASAQADRPEAGFDDVILLPTDAERMEALLETWRVPMTHPGPRMAAAFGAAAIAPLFARFRDRLLEALELDRDAARKTAHGLAGIAGTLGFDELHAPWLALSEGDPGAWRTARHAARRALFTLDRGPPPGSD